MAKAKKKPVKKATPTKRKTAKRPAKSKGISKKDFKTLVSNLFLISQGMVLKYSKSYGIDGKELASVLIDSELESEVQELVNDYLENRFEELVEDLDTSKLKIIE